jgi:hypothetical protein
MWILHSSQDSPRMYCSAMIQLELSPSMGSEEYTIASDGKYCQPLRAASNRYIDLIVYQASRLDPLVLAGAVLAMSLVGLLATWIPPGVPSRPSFPCWCAKSESA